MQSPEANRRDTARCTCVALCLLLVGCAPDELPLAPVTGGGATGSDTGGTLGSGPISIGPGDSGDDSGLPAHCVLDEGGADDTGTSADGGTGFKFDVGAPEGSTDFPVDCTEVAETLTNLGCEFWAVDLPNDYRGTAASPPASEQQFAVVVANTSALGDANVSIYVAAEDMAVATAAVPPGETFEFALDPLDIDPVTSTDDGFAYRIESDVPITAYQFNPLDNKVQVYSNDASLLLPVHALGRDYTAVTANAILLGMSAADPDPVNAGAFVSVVATEDDTEVDIMAVTGIVGGISSATLDRGRVFTILSEAQGVASGNFSGSRVTADKPVAVFGGNVATAIPSNQPKCCADHVEHQLPPHEAWGSAYAVAPPPSPIAETGDTALYRITGAFADTELRYCPTQPQNAPTSLQPGQTFSFETSLPFTVESDPDKPFALTQFLESFQALSEDQPGDPAMIVIPAIGQWQKRYLFAVPAGYAFNYVTVVTQGFAEVTIDGEAIDTEQLASVGVARGHEQFFTYVPVGTGAHLVESEVPVGITVIGFDAAVSYGYAGGAGLRVIAIPPVEG